MFKDRIEAGQKLADALETIGPFENPIVLALPRGGVPVAYEVAKRLHAPLDVIIVRKLGAPFNEEFAIGALVEGEPERVVLNEDAVYRLGIGKSYLDEVVAKEREELHRRQQRYRGSQNPLENLAGKTVILIDDGIATGYTMKAALAAIREQNPASIVVAVPVAPSDTLPEMERLADRVVVLQTPEPFWAVGAHYERFDQTSDEEVIELLEKARHS
ncbi:phosphoribosyltransferase [Hydrogenimonas cancrithermarum]|uniref:Phosphoribosyltransferase n=1 Tax=Hydrogenimonas cancrithermarum TaxID=2993563 RepID=A0ABN6WSI3_9BACT|nr:phosphoribosyltransferase [Hydrogenimonas cancrithermarum]BDY12019.1 phosphoribosyltransferase [Hydrogenimonas cancrithermarum]